MLSTGLTLSVQSFQLTDEEELTRCDSFVRQNNTPDTRVSLSATEEVDEFIDQNIQINTNKQMRDEFLYAWTLKFKDPQQEHKFGQLREDMFRSNMLCVFIIWMFIVVCQSIIVSSCNTLFIFLGIATLVMISLLVLVMAEEFDVCPELLAKSSTSLVHHRNRRSVFICCVIILMALGSAIALLLCPFQPVRLDALNSTTNGGDSDARASRSGGSSGNVGEVRVNVFLTATIHHNITINTNQNASALDTLLAGTGTGPSESSNGTVDYHQSSGSGSNGTTPGNIDWTKLVSLSQLQTHLKHAISVRDVSSANSLLNELWRRHVNKSQGATAEAMGSEISEGTTTDPLLLDVEQTVVADGSGGDLEEEEEEIDSCSHPEYLVFSWVLCLIALATALKLYYIIKTMMAIIMVVSYTLLILGIFPDVFSGSNPEFEFMQMGMPLAAQMLILLAVFLTMVCYHARLVEVTSRLDFIWKEQAEKELINMKSNRMLNDLLIKVGDRRGFDWDSGNNNDLFSHPHHSFQNILPDHVASYYLSDERNDELYAHMHNLCGVMFASIPNFKDFYSEDIENGIACIRILNEIICDFDALLEEERFASIEKIKTVGATYMAASGLNPKYQVGEETADPWINNIY